MSPAPRCLVCAMLTVEDLIALDTVMGSPLRWPPNVFGRMTPPKGHLPGNWRYAGAIGAGLSWLSLHDHREIRRASLERHYKLHVTVSAVTDEELIGAGVIQRRPDGEIVPTPDIAAVDPTRYLTVFAEGIELGITAMREIRRRIANPKAGEEVSLVTLQKMVDVGSALARAQASGFRFAAPPSEDPDKDLWRQAVGDDAGPRIGEFRIRTVDGVRRPIRDQGPKDRATYNRRARQEGSPLLPSRE